MLAILLSAAGLALVTAAFLAGRRELAALLKVTPSPMQGALLVVIPARDEGKGIAACLERVLAERAPGLRVLVVDDRSSDDTAAVVARAAQQETRLSLLRLDDDPPAGTFGKPRALALAIEHARAAAPLPERVLFLDADVLLESGALGGLMRALESSGARALSGVPRLHCLTLLEQLLVPTIVPIVVRGHGPTRVHDPRDPTAFLNGQLILVDTAAYLSTGGFAALAHTVLEDVALARALKSRGHALRLADLRALASTRMYSSWRGIVEGFGKNAVALLGAHAWAMGALALLTSLLPWLGLALSLHAGDTRAIAITGAIVGATALVQALARRRSGAPLWPVLVLPLAYLGVAWVLARASWRALRRQPTTWKGRDYG